LTVIDIFNFRDGNNLRPTGYLPSYIDELMDRELLKLEFLYGDDGDGDSGAAERSVKASATNGRAD